MGVNRRQFLFNEIVRADSTKNSEDIFNGDVEETYWNMVNAGKIPASFASSARSFSKRSLQTLNTSIGVMATPPTITVGVTNAASTIASAVNLPYNTSNVRFFGGTPRLRNTNGINSYQNGTNASLAANENPPFFVEFGFDGSVFEWGAFGGGSGGPYVYRIKVDGLYENVTPHAGPGGTGGLTWYKVDFGSRAIRRIVLELSYIEFCGLNVGPNDTVWVPSQPKPTRALFLGDSYLEGQSSTANPLQALQFTASRLLGWEDVWTAAQGGTGYLNSGPVGHQVAKDRIATDVIPYNPDVVVVALGINDTTTNNAAWTLSSGLLQAAASSLYAQIKAALPYTQLYVINGWYPLAPVYQPIEDATTAIAAACANNPNVTALISPRGWITGTGKSGATTGSGNADLYTGTDGIHPTQAGHDYLGQRVAAAIAATLPTY